MALDTLFFGLWLLWLLYWGISALGVKRAVRVESRFSRFGKYMLPIIIAVLLLWSGRLFRNSFLDERFVPFALWLVWLGFALTVAGLALTCWARVILGRNWSGVVQLKHDHELIVRGPYSIVRHPIYTGLLLAFAGTALAIGEWRAVIATAIMAISFWRKLRLEERWLCEFFGEQYRNYMRQVKALVPWLL
ncbi:isoprenylcysteine carboxylmethyltransferase family protein [Dyella jejuensis]|uniref:Isoprenylcysteine carboxylmethyltransferase family protein n=1 Tax=Dyella jejuensis TaxID=1432009 RepID=A0ABW8JJ76_9GAMM